MNKVSTGAICSICNYDAYKRYDDFKKILHLNADDLDNFQRSCMRHVGENLPLLEKLLKSMYKLSQMKRDYSEPKSELLYDQYSFFASLNVGDIKEHLKCNVKIMGDENVNHCNNF